jgi:hypothetical protein
MAGSNADALANESTKRPFDFVSEERSNEESAFAQRIDEPVISTGADAIVAAQWRNPYPIYFLSPAINS